jgi:pimeloyl-ACP methyl ester carboxylesterase
MGSGLGRVAAAVAVIAGMAGVVTVPAPAVRAATSTGVTPARLRWRGCGEGFQCASLQVPLDYAARGGPTIDLAVVRRRARKPDQRIGSLVFNPGGPGDPANDYLRAVADLLPDVVQDRFDLVSFDPRGVGASSPIACEPTLDPLFDQSFSPSSTAQRTALTDALKQLAAACGAANPTLLAHVSTSETARDLDRLRAALGDRKLSFVGFSYGTYLGTRYASMYPARVRAFVLDGAIDPTLDGAASVLHQAKGFERALDDFLADCSAHPKCVFHHHGDAAGAYDALRARAAREPIPAAAEQGRLLNQTRFDAAVVQDLYAGRSQWPTLAHALSEAGRGDASQLLGDADAFAGRDPTGRDDHSLDAFWAITCLDGPVVGSLTAAQRVEAEAHRIAPRLGPFLVNNSLVCSVWPVPPVTPPGRLAANGTPPILVIGTTGDPATPFVQAQALARVFEHGALLVVKGDGHTAFMTGNACVDRGVARYLVFLTVPTRGTRC